MCERRFERMRVEATILICACLFAEIRSLKFQYPTREPKVHEVTSTVFLDVVQRGKPLGRILIGLHEKDTPITAGYFKQLATTGINDTFLKGSFFHKVLKGFKVQGGEGMDINLVYDEEYGCSYTVQQEEGKVPHTEAGIVSMASRGPHMKWTEFFITTIPTPWLDYHDVAFGKVVSGMDVVSKIEKTKITIEARPVIPIYIKECGLIPVNETETREEIITVTSEKPTMDILK